MSWLLQGVKKLTGSTEYIAAAVLLLMMLHVVADVAGRNLFNYPAPATTEMVAYYYMIAVVFLPLPFVELRDRSIAVDLFYNWFSPAAKRLAKAFGTLASILFFSGLTFKSWIDAWAAYDKREMVDGLYVVEIWQARFGLPIAFALTVAVLTIRFAGELTAGKNPLQQNAVVSGEDSAGGTT
jgi:TRAP-type C4-dicarboxylate transport system permease small subunit